MWIIELIQANPIWQFCGFTATWMTIYWLIQKDDKQTMKIIMISSIFWILQWYFLEIYSAMFSSAIWLSRVLLSMKYKRNKKIFSLIITTTLLVWILTYTNPYSILPIFAQIISAYWFFFFERLRLRIFMFLSSLLRLTFSFGVWSVWWTINEIIVQCMLLLAMYRIMIEDHRRIYILEKLISKLHEKKLDIDRFIIIYDFIKLKKHSIKYIFIHLYEKIHEKFHRKKVV